MTIRVYEYAKCSTCRNALKWLDAHAIAYERVPIVETPPSRAELAEMLRRVGDIRKLFNTSGELYRAMKISEKLPSMTKDQALDLLSKHGKLIKRPFVPAKGLVGFKEADWQAALKA